MESPPEEKHEHTDDVGSSADVEELKSEKRDFREQDEVDKFLKEEREKAETINEEEVDAAEINTGEFEAGEARTVHVEYPAWLKRVEYGSKVMPTEACVIGDAQPELIKILLLQMGNNLLKIHRHYQRNVCEDTESAWQHFRRVPKFRLDLDPRVPYLGEDDSGNLIEPTDEQMKELYREIGSPGTKKDLGEDGFANAYHGALIFKKLITYILECGYALSDLQQLFSDDGIEQLMRGTAEDEIRKSTAARENLDAQSHFVRRVIAGAYNVNAVYFFRNGYQYSVTLNPVDILCACRPQIRRIAVLHLILQNGQQLPRPLLSKLRDAIEEYNCNKKREGQRPRWGTHLTEPHLAAIATCLRLMIHSEGQVLQRKRRRPRNRVQVPIQNPKEQHRQPVRTTLHLLQSRFHSLHHHEEKENLRKRATVQHHHGENGKTVAKEVEKHPPGERTKVAERMVVLLHIEVATGTTQGDTTTTEDGDKFTSDLNVWVCNHCS